MGVVQLPTYEAQEVERGTRLPSREGEFAAMASVGRAQAAAADTVMDAVTGIGKAVITKAKSDEFTKATTAYNAWATNRLREIQEHPLNPGDPEYDELSAEERANPNTAIFNKDRKEWLEANASKLFWPKVKEAFAQWVTERGISENDGLMRFDYVKAHEMALDSYQDATLIAIEQEDTGRVKELAGIALKADVITPKMYDDTMDMAYKDISKEKAKRTALTMGAGGLEWIADADNLKYETYNGEIHTIPPDEHKALINEFKVIRQERADEQDAIFSEKFIRANTLEDIASVELDLAENLYMLGTQKRTWSEWLREKKKRILSGEQPSADMVSSKYSRMYKAVDENRNPALEVTIDEIDRDVTDPQDHQAILAKRNELQKSHESGGHSTREDVFYEAYRIANDPIMSEAAKNKWIDDHTVMGGGLSPDDGMKVRGWIKPYNDDPQRKLAMDSIQQAYKISMENETDKKKQLKIGLDLYNAQIALDKMFRDPKTTQPMINAAVTQFLEGKVVQDIMTELSRVTGGAGFPVAGKFAGTARELETAREKGLFTQFPEREAEFETIYRTEAIKQEQAELKRMGISFVKQEMNSFGDQVYTTADGKEYVVLQTREDQNGKPVMVERTYQVEHRTVNGKEQIRYVRVK